MPAQAQDERPSTEWTDAEIEAAVNKVRAGRDLNPDHWPGGARVAVLLSFDVDNETIWLRNNDTNVGGLSQGEYGSRVALGRVLDLLDEHGVAASFFGPAVSFSLAPQMIDAIQSSGRHEIGVHGWIHERNADVRPIITAEMLHWRDELIPLIERIKLRYPPRNEVDSRALADMFLSTFEGAFVLSKALQEPQTTAEQLRLYKTFIETLFSPD